MDPDQLSVLWRCSRTEYPNMEEGGPLNSRLWSWSRLYPAAGGPGTQMKTRTSADTLAAERCMMEGKLQEENKEIMLTSAWIGTAYWCKFLKISIRFIPRCPGSNKLLLYSYSWMGFTLYVNCQPCSIPGIWVQIVQNDVSAGCQHFHPYL